MAIVVEGQTEGEFVKRVLSNHLLEQGVLVKEHELGGGVNVHKIASEMLRYCRSYDVVSSLVDYYGFGGRGRATVAELEQQISEEVRKRAPGGLLCKIYPYVQLHEFEGLLFSDVKAFGKIPGVTMANVQRLEFVRGRFAAPECINSGEHSAPSKRIKGVIPTYEKVVNGVSVAQWITLPKIREECKRFDSWIACLESVGKEPG